MTTNLPTTRPGCCVFGYDTTDGLPLVRPPWVRISLAISTDPNSLAALGITAFNSALRLPGNRNQTGVILVTKFSDRWPSHLGAKIVEPVQFHELAYKMMNRKISHPSQHALVILDSPDKSWKIEPGDIEKLVKEQPAASVLVLGEPEYATNLLGTLDETYQRPIQGGHEDDFVRAPFLFPLYGSGSEGLAKVADVPSPLPYGCFAFRKTSKWHVIMTNAPTMPARIRQTELAVTG